MNSHYPVSAHPVNFVTSPAAAPGRYETTGADSVTLDAAAPGGYDMQPVAWGSLSRSELSFHRWLYRWYSQTGDVSPGTPYLARKQGKSERTIYRWLSDLERAGAVRREVVVGVERSIVPLAPPPAAPPVARRLDNRHPAARRSVPSPVLPAVLSGVAVATMSATMSGGIPKDAFTQEATTHRAEAVALPVSGVVAELVQVGVSDAVAVGLVRLRGERECREQLEALPFRKAQDLAAVLVASIRDKWAKPAGLVRHREQQQRAATIAARQQAVQVVASTRQNQQEALTMALNGLSDTQRDTLRARAIDVFFQECPHTAAGVLAGHGGESALRTYMLRLLAAQIGGTA